MARERGKYAELIDEETWAFIERTEAAYPADSTSLTIDQQRDFYNALCASFHAGHPEGVTARDFSIEASGRTVPLRRYELAGSNPGPVVVYYHGGGYVVGGLESHDDICAEICAGSGYPVVAVDYALAPENSFPADFEDAIAAFRDVAGDAKGPVIVCGDSAGGNLAAAVAHASRGGDLRPAGVVLIYPGLGGDLTRSSFVEHAEAPMLTTADTQFYKRIRFGGAEPPVGDPGAMPLEDSDFSGLPPTVVFSAECDPLQIDGPEYEEKIRAAGGSAVCFTETGLVHGYLRARHSVARARDSFNRIVEAVGALGKGEWPYQ